MRIRNRFNTLFPSTKLNDINLDWLISTMKQLWTEFKEWPRTPLIRNDHWWIWDDEQEDYVDTGTPATGPQGAQGEQGPQGAQGATGPQGDAGISIRLYDTPADRPDAITEPDGSLAIVVTDPNFGNYALFEDDGWAWANKGKLQGPQGPQGPQGVPGEVTQAEFDALSDDFSNLESALTVSATGDPNDFTNNYLTSGGNESPSTKLILSKRYFNYQQDKLISVETSDPYGIYAYGFKRAAHLGLLRENGTFATSSSSPILYADKINLADYPDITFKFALRHNVNGSPVDISTDEAVNLKFTFEVNRELARRKISVIGDSISTFTGYISPGAPSAYYPLNLARMYYVENMYWQTLADRNGMDIEVIDAYGGSTVADKWQTSTRIPFYDDSRVNRLGDPDVIIVEGGINDFGGNPLGDYPPLGDYTKTYEFRTAYSLLLNKLKQKYKRATIICLSMVTPHSYNNTTFPEKQTEVVQALATDTTPHAFAEFNESIEHIAKQYQCAYCDITDLSNYYANPNSSLGPHWYFNVHQEVAYRIEQTLKDIYA